ncbi:MAG: DUF4139 domain-containing protein [Armatimonadota bacterium]
MITTLLAVSALLVEGSTEITVYSQGLGFVKDIRLVDVKAGQQSLIVEDVAQLIDATSVGFRCLNNPGSISILEQNYQYDLISPMAILQKSIGKKIRFTRSIGNSKEVIEGVLISSPTSVVNTGSGSEYSYNDLVIRANDGRIILSPQGEIDVMEVPEGLISKPSLVWQINSAKAQQAKMELSYLTKGMSWTANYVLTLGDAGSGDIQGWVTLNNQSGLTFNDAKLKLLAGDVNVVQDEDTGVTKQKWTDNNRKRALLDPVRSSFSEQSLFEYHLYTLGRPASVRNKETKQLSLLAGSNIPIKKIIAFDSYADPENDSGDSQQDLDSSVMVKFRNDEKSHLGMPMPAGKVRLYQRDTGGSLQFLGENEIQHTPRDEKISLTVGKSFDVKVSHKKTSYTKLGKNSSRSSYSIEVRNRKKVGETVYVYEHQSGDWKVTDKSDPFVKEDSNTMIFKVKLKAGEVKTVKYTVESRW